MKGSKIENKQTIKDALCVQVSPRKKVWVYFEDDTFPNKGGYYCKAYATEERDERFMAYDFTIRKEELGCAENRVKNALSRAKTKVETYFRPM